jgi:transmembrane sensor
MTDSVRNNLLSLIAARAAYWVARMGSDQRTRADDEALARWLDENAAHRTQFDAQKALWDQIGALSDDPVARQILGRARKEPGGQDDAEVAAASRVSRRSLFFGGAVAAAAAMMGAFWLAAGTEFSTRPGQQRNVTLADGSTVTLDTDTRIDVALDDGERRVRLRSGQAYFDVAPDKARPFRVLVEGNEIRALGTEFNVRRDGRRTEVYLAHGSVAIRKRGTEIILRPGQQALISPAKAPRIVTAEPDRMQSWRQGKLIFDATPLAEAVAEVNRYGGKPIRLADAATGRIKVSGVFHVGRSEAFVESVTVALPIEVERNNEQETLLGQR